MFAIVATPAKMYYTEPVSVKISDHYSERQAVVLVLLKLQETMLLLSTQLNWQWKKDTIRLSGLMMLLTNISNESGTMNVFVRINDTIYTPPTSEKILDGVTRDSFIQLAKKRGFEIKVEPIKVKKML
ncbi:aminotransferase class IV [Chryseobacterium indoltheticum]|uniref:aminotransferase class IV n=1 Tax=Chryseobacterium indoltheticum TaxID=254 RepID=UPI003F49AD2F